MTLLNEDGDVLLGLRHLEPVGRAAGVMGRLVVRQRSRSVRSSGPSAARWKGPAAGPAGFGALGNPPVRRVHDERRAILGKARADVEPQLEVGIGRARKGSWRSPRVPARRPPRRPRLFVGRPRLSGPGARTLQRRGGARVTHIVQVRRPQKRTGRIRFGGLAGRPLRGYKARRRGTAHEGSTLESCYPPS